MGALTAAAGAVALALVTILYPNEKTTRLDTVLAGISIVGTAVVVTAALVKLVQGIEKDRKENDDARLDGFHAVLHVIHSIVRHKAKLSRNETDRLRVSIHRVVRPEKKWGHPEEVEQMLDYVGGNGKHAGRRFSIRTGIIGRAIREREAFAVSRKSTDHKAFIKEMVQEWGFTSEEAAKLTFDRNSWMAVPILYRGGEVTGVVYLDSNDSGIFTEDVRNEVVSACAGLAVFISERY